MENYLRFINLTKQKANFVNCPMIKESPVSVECKVTEIKELGSYYNQIVKMAPGLTGLWQVSGRSDCAFEDRLKLDYKYYYNRGLKKDFEIVLKTFEVVLKGKGAK